MLCVELEVIALLIEMIDFQQYMEEEDYYNAGLVAAFVWFPFGRLGVKGLKTLFLKVFQKSHNIYNDFIMCHRKIMTSHTYPNMEKNNYTK